jgi:hypothetical protein
VTCSMRRKGHPSFPSAMTCCFFSSLKTLLMPTEPIRAPVGVNVPGFPMAGFQLTLHGRIWVTPEGDSIKDQTGLTARPDRTALAEVRTNRSAYSRSFLTKNSGLSNLTIDMSHFKFPISTLHNFPTRERSLGARFGAKGDYHGSYASSIVVRAFVVRNGSHF